MFWDTVYNILTGMDSELGDFLLVNVRLALCTDSVTTCK